MTKTGKKKDNLEKLRILTIKYNLYSGLILVHERGKQLISNKSYKMINNGKTMWISVLLCFSGALRNTGHKQPKGWAYYTSQALDHHWGKQGQEHKQEPRSKNWDESHTLEGCWLLACSPRILPAILLIQHRLTCPEMALPTRLSLLPPSFENHENALQTCPQASLIEAIQLRVPLPKSVKLTTKITTAISYNIFPSFL